MSELTARRVGHVVNSLGSGGVATVAAALLERLPASGTRTLYCLSDRCRDPGERAARVARLAVSGVRVRFADAPGAAAAGAQVARWAVEDGLDLLHTHSTKPNRHVRAALPPDGGPRTVAHFHNTYDDKWADPVALHVERTLAPVTDRLVAVSKAVREHVVDRLGVAPERVEVVGNGIDLDAFRGGDPGRLRAELGLAADVPIVGTAGRLSRQKAPQDLVRAARLVLDREPRAVFLLAGDPDEPGLAAQVRALADGLGLGDHLRLLGHRSDLADVYAALDVFVLPSHWEGFGLVLVEAMAAGVPVVATRVGGVPEVVGTAPPSAVLVPPGEPALLAAAVARLLAAPQERAALTARGRVRAERFGWAGPARRLAALYDDLLAPVPAGAR